MYYKGEKMEGPVFPNTDFHGYGRAIRKELRNRIATRRKVRVLDVGTGLGQNTAFLLRHLSNNSEIWTVDPSEEVLAGARASLGRKASRVNFVQANAERLDFADGFFDVVVSVMVLHHVEDAQAVLAELSRVLKKAGRLLLVDYTPEAANRLEFHTRHEKRDFFEPKIVGATLRRLGLACREADFGNWYLIDARK
jgi:ubiquinone/menaquinone biosynthesis C-methylase UbiE